MQTNNKQFKIVSKKTKKITNSIHNKEYYNPYLDQESIQIAQKISNFRYGKKIGGNM